ncbi:MAG: translation initiation factor IF-2, partial [Cohaesibacteraceae bacterium]|nr:translation initiation factor IF-2 [Cohaesibacteraceae bacterium]
PAKPRFKRDAAGKGRPDKRRPVQSKSGAPSGPKGLTNSEQSARLMALREAQKRADGDKAKRDADEARRIEAAQKRRTDAENRAAAEAALEKKRIEEQAAKLKILKAKQAEQQALKDKRDAEKKSGDDRPARDGANRGRPDRGDRPARTGDRPARPSGGRPGGVSAGRPTVRPGPIGRAGPKLDAKAPPPDAENAKPTTRRVPMSPNKVANKPGANDRQQPKPTRNLNQQRRRGKLTLSNALNPNDRERSLASVRRRREKEKRAMRGQQTPREKVSREVILPEAITVQDLAQRMSERAVDVIKLLMQQGQMLKPADTLDADTAELIASEMGHTVKRVSESDVEEGLFVVEEIEENLVSRPPVITIMGHVDHGKTSLLDAIRETNVVRGEAGGITQHIGAYQVEKNGRKLTFIDTPGHAAFTEMRARGAQSTDIVVLVVAADDSVMPQTIEAINHAKAANVPIIVAINKIDRPAADVQKVRNELLQHDVFVESMGGEVLDVEVSALEGTNLDKLLDTLLLQAELLELKANPDRFALGTVVEANLDKGRGPVATVLIQHGTLKIGDIIVGGRQWGRVRALLDDELKQVPNATPSQPVAILGFQGVPDAGDQFAVVDSEAKAREIVEYRQRQYQEKSQVKSARGSLEQLMERAKTSGVQKFPLVIKGDVHGSVEAIIGSLEKIGNEEVQANIIHSAVGAVTESDVALAETSNSPILAFNVRANKQAQEAAKRAGVEIRYYNIIYDLTDDIKAAMSGLLAPEMRETFIGYAEILEVFNITKVGKIAGCRVTEGTVERGSGVRLLRDNIVIHEGKLGTLKRFKDEVKDVVSGQECGMAFENYHDLREKDVIECFRVEEITRTL